MIPEFGKNAAFIWAAYGISFLAVAGLIFAAFQADRHD
ncbi:MAG: heme exporter protein CcmD [Hyphomonadaceae bacterium]|nr:heme exporter protein CcmD [Hyphomonadaceae bacterium]